MRPPAAIIAAIVLAPALAGCRPDDSFPSLAPRPIERPAPVPTTAPVGLTTNAALDAEATRLSAEADAGARSFEDEAAAAVSVIAAGAGAAQGSEPWVQAEQALARVEAAREPLTRALAALDALRIEQQAAGGHIDTTRLDAAWDRAQALQQKQIERYEALSAQVPAA